MVSFNIDKLHAAKANSILKRRQLRKIASMLRFVEVCVVLVLISRLSIQLPVAVKNSSEYFRDFSVFVVSPRFVFLVGNVIIIILFAQSGQFSAHGSATKSAEPDIYQEFIQNSTRNQKIHGEQPKYPRKENSIKSQSIDGDQVKYPEKQSIIKEDSINIKSKKINGNLIKYPEKQSMKLITKTGDRKKEQRIDYGGHIKWPEKQSIQTGDTNVSLEVKEYRRCQTEIIRHVQSEKSRGVLERCETENRRSSIQHAASPSERVGRTSYPEDGMSNEEFRLTIEAFIARQQRLRREEECFTV